MKSRISNTNYNLDQELLKCSNDGERNAVNRGFCLDEYRKANANFDKDNYNGPIYIFKCGECNYLELRKSSSQLCKKCGWSKKFGSKKFECRICHNSFFKNKEFLKCSNDGERNAVNRGFCLDCYNNTVSDFDKNIYFKYIYYRKCNNCMEFSLSIRPINKWICPKCNYKSVVQECSYTCPICNTKETVRSSNWTCPKCGWNNIYGKQKFQCRISNKIIDLNQELLKCSNDGERNAVNRGFCLDEYRKANANFDKGDYKGIIYLHQCKKCNQIKLTNSSNFICECGYKNFTDKNYKHICKNCNYKENNKTPTHMWTCPKCGWKPNNFLPGNIMNTHYCNKCGFSVIDNRPINTWICPKCNNKVDNFLHGGLNRNEFYKNKLSIISFNFIDKEITLNDFDSLKGKLGVWSRWTDKNHGNYCLDVCKTIDIGKEMLSSLRSFNSLKENPNQLLDTYWKRKYMNQAKDADIFNGGKIIFKLVAYCDSEDEALKVEQQYAHDNKAKYWSLGIYERLLC